MKTLVINSESALAEALYQIESQWRREKYLEVEIHRRAGSRTMTQNRAMHLFFRELADTLNDAGFDMRRTLRQDVDVPWSEVTVKEHLWRPIQIALTHKRSTTDITTVEPSEIHEVLCRHLGQRLGITCPPWPHKKAPSG